MAEPVELPVDARKCPLCGRGFRAGFQRIWSGYTVGVISKTGPEPLPRMDHDAVKRMDRIEEMARAGQSQPSQNFEVAHGFGVKAVPLGRVGQAVGELAAATAGPQAGMMTAAAVQQGVKAGTSDYRKGQVKRATVTPPRRPTQIMGRWDPTPSEIAKARA